MLTARPIVAGRRGGDDVPMALPDGIFPEARLLLYGGPCVHCANAENPPAVFRMPLTPLDPALPGRGVPPGPQGPD